MAVTLGQQYNVGEKPTVMLYTYINHHAEPPNLPLLFFVYFQVNNGVLYFLDYEDKLHHGPLCSRFNVEVNLYL